MADDTGNIIAFPGQPPADPPSKGETGIPWHELIDHRISRICDVLRDAELNTDEDDVIEPVQTAAALVFDLGRLLRQSVETAVKLATERARERRRKPLAGGRAQRPTARQSVRAIVNYPAQLAPLAERVGVIPSDFAGRDILDLTSAIRQAIKLDPKKLAPLAALVGVKDGPRCSLSAIRGRVEDILCEAEDAQPTIA